MASTRVYLFVLVIILVDDPSYTKQISNLMTSEGKDGQSQLLKRSTRIEKSPVKTVVVRKEISEASEDDDVQGPAKYSERSAEQTERNVKLVRLSLYTMGIIVLLVILLIGFWKDPACCLFLLVCPCCVLCLCCYRSFVKRYMDANKIMKGSVHKYVPGIIVGPHGELEQYCPTSEEMRCLGEVLNISEGIN